MDWRTKINFPSKTIVSHQTLVASLICCFHNLFPGYLFLHFWVAPSSSYRLIFFLMICASLHPFPLSILPCSFLFFIYHDSFPFRWCCRDITFHTWPICENFSFIIETEKSHWRHSSAHKNGTYAPTLYHLFIPFFSIF